MNPLGRADYQVPPLGQGVDHVSNYDLLGFGVKIDQHILEKNAIERLLFERMKKVVLLPGDERLDFGLYDPALGLRILLEERLSLRLGSIRRTALTS